MNTKITIKPALLFSLSLPAAFLYMLLILFTSNSLVGAVFGYLCLSISFGLFQSLFTIYKPYRTAFLVCTLIPTIAYLFFALLSLLVFYGLANGGYTQMEDGGLSIAMSGSVAIEPLPYIGKLGYAAGLTIYLVVIALLVITFGLTGVAGRFLGDEVIPNLLKQSPNKAVVYQREQGGILLQVPSVVAPKHEKVSAYATAAAAIISALASIFAAFL